MLDPTRLIFAAGCGIVLLLVLIIKVKLHPVLSLLLASLFIGVGAGMPIQQLTTTVEEGAGKTLQGIVLLIGLGSMFGGILEVSGGAQAVAQRLTSQFGENKAGIALGITGLIVGTAVFFEAGVMILIPLAFSLAKKTGKSTVIYVIPILAGLASGFAYIPPSAGSVLVANMLGANLGLVILVGVPTGILSLGLAGVVWGKFIGNKVYAPAPIEEEATLGGQDRLPQFQQVLMIILIPLVLILLNTLSGYTTLLDPIKPLVSFLGTPFVALLCAILTAQYLLGTRQGYSRDQLKTIFDKALHPTAGILLVITGGGIISEVLQVCGMGEMVGQTLGQSGLPLILIAFLIAGMIRICIGASVVSMTMTAGIMMSMPAMGEVSDLYIAAMVLAINGGATAFSHVNDSGFWMVSSLLKISEKDTLKTWTVMETIVGCTGLAVALTLTLFA